jgi:FAD/FMN-containing dehydrogenase
MTRIMGWGRHPVVEGVEILSEDLEAATRDARLSRGLGRSYGDCSLPPASGERVAASRLADRVLDFDPERGLLRAEAGLSLTSLQAILQPRGFAVPVVPGTVHLTLGGMVAADIHGKNHHTAGTFGQWVRELRMRVADGRVLDVSPHSEPELFWATLGGMGLTGHVLEVEFQLERIPSPWIWQEVERATDLDELVGRLRLASRDWPFTMTWVDCLARGRNMGRGILVKGRWARADEAPDHAPPQRPVPTFPFDLPGFVLSPPTMRIFNGLVYHGHRLRPTRGVVSPRPFFHPLDGIHQWNRAYGRRGMTQHQSVLPPDESGTTYRRYFEILAHAGEGSFTGVLKDLGREGRGLLSFPMPGLTVSVDLPVRGARTQALIDRLNEVVIEAGGRVYLAKDAFTRPDQLRAMEPRLDAFLEVRRKWDPGGRLASAQSVRLFGDRA